MNYLNNKVVVITGASSGIGWASAIEFAKKGAKVVIVARRLDRLVDLNKQLVSIGVDSMYAEVDVTKESEVIELFKEIETKFGGVDILINNVGKGLKSKFNDISCDDWLSAVHTNLTSVFLCTKEASNMMIRNKTRGHIITISSLAGLFNIPGYSGYCSTKHAVTSFKSSIKWELRKHNIKVSTVHPYKVDTEFFDSYEKRPGKSQMLTPRDIAQYLIAIAEKNILKRLFIKLLNMFKRVYYLIRYIK